MATINVKEESSTPDSLSDYETKTHDKRLSLAEELDATQNELKEAEDKLTAAIQQVRSIFSFLVHLHGNHHFQFCLRSVNGVYS